MRDLTKPILLRVSSESDRDEKSNMATDASVRSEGEVRIYPETIYLTPPRRLNLYDTGLFSSLISLS